MKRRWSFFAVFAAVLLGLAAPMPAMREVAAQGVTNLKIATLFPARSSHFRTLQAWGQSVSEHTSGAVTLEFVSLGRTADEGTFVSGMRDGTYQGAVLTASGLNAAVPSALALGAPGLVTDYNRLDRVRGALQSDMNGAFNSAGYRLLGWADYGRARIFSTAEVARPAAMSGRHLWVNSNDPISGAIASATGASPVGSGIGGVRGAIDGGRIDTVYASSMAVVSLNWHGASRLRFVSRDAFGIIVGATVLTNAGYNAIPAAHRAAFDQDAARAHQQLNTALHRDDDRNYTTATTRGVTEVDTSPGRADWDGAFGRARGSLGGRIPAALLGRVQSTR